MTNLYLKELSPNVYCVWGKFDRLKYNLKKIVVDGETYTKEDCEVLNVEIIESDYSNLDDCIIYEYDQLKNFYLPTIKIYITRMLNGWESLKTLIGGGRQSENGYVNGFYHLWYYIKPASWADFIDSQMQKISIRCNIQRIDKYQKSILEYSILAWGFNNSFEVWIYAHELPKYNYQEIVKQYMMWTGQYDHLIPLKKDMTESQKLEFSIKEIEKLGYLVDEYNKLAEKEKYQLID